MLQADLYVSFEDVYIECESEDGSYHTENHGHWLQQKYVISFCWRCLDGLRCKRWIVTNDLLKIYWSFIIKMIAEQEDHARLKKKMSKKNNRFDYLLACKDYLRKKAAYNFTYLIILFYQNIDNILVVFV